MADPAPSTPLHDPHAHPGIQLPPARWFVDRAFAVLTRPAQFYASIREEKGFGQPVLFAAGMGLASGVIAAVYGLLHLGYGSVGIGLGGVLGALILTPLLTAAFGAFVGGAIVHAIALVCGGKGTYEDSVRIAAYACAITPVSALLGFLPLLAMIPHFYGLYVCALGIVALHATDRRRTLMVVGIIAVVLLLVDVNAWLAARRADAFVRGLGAQMQK